MRTTLKIATLVAGLALAVGCQQDKNKDQMPVVGNGSQPQTTGTHDNPMVNSDGVPGNTNVSSPSQGATTPNGVNAPALNGSSATPSAPVGGGTSTENGGSSSGTGMNH